MGKAISVFAACFAVIALLINFTVSPYTKPWAAAPGDSSASTQPSAPPPTTEPTTRPDIDKDRSGTKPPPARPPGMVDSPTGTGLLGFFSQKVQWKPCDSTTMCATVLAPLDWSEPQAGAITLAMRKKPATAQPTLGPLFVNPGGPGISGQWLAESIEQRGLEKYDIIGFDPRGTGESTPVQCSAADKELIATLDLSPDNEPEWKSLVDATRAYAEGCLNRSGALLAHVSTRETVLDMDLMRKVLGATMMNFLGFSYGSKLGATYAMDFPETTGKIVLDGVMHMPNGKYPPVWRPGVTKVKGQQDFELAFTEFAKWCVSKTCSLGKTAEEVSTLTRQLLDRMDTNPIAVGPRMLTQSQAVQGILSLLYTDKDWTFLENSINEVNGGNGTKLLDSADEWNGRNKDGSYNSETDARTAISCLDNPDLGLAYAKAVTEEITKAPATLSKFYFANINCEVWPVKSQHPYAIEQLKPATPILAIGGKYDPATPYHLAQDFVRDISPTAILITFDGQGHTAFGRNKCATDLVTAYFSNGTVPSPGTVCKD